ncbi:hypothetical protein [Maribacter cobaltidurans]|uniref:Uncharacterized protein n=1 Tax=Maribacter cobaltidurans TaxID=1178778 RepID=A0A223V6N6_9FLAO|nr:hypothetical protein [Maribacter cobaltidurans]ASV31084.1 hypothetical protein CJ263_13165 [Maribacter cobaltidurans]GGD96585.1 hypothetical protein GCM10011412_38420 [Maribacter cobaltidurans]
MQLDSANYDPTAFIALSPLKNLSNIDHNIQAKSINKFRFPVDFWTPDKNVEQLFALDEKLYKKVYDKKTCNISIDRENEINRIKCLINNFIQKKEHLKFANWISIQDSDEELEEDESLKTTLDEKLNTLFEEDDERRIEYHRLRANYKIYLASLEDLSPALRANILNWEYNLRIKAKRLSDKFSIDESYSAHKFFYDFFEIAEKEIISFYKDYDLKGDKEKLLNGVVFELAAQCPLDWRDNGTT